MIILITGIGVSSGKAPGLVKIVSDVEEASKKINKGDILVTDMTNPDFTLFMAKSAAIITNTGGMLCHAAIVARELGIPCVTGTKNATEVLKDGTKVLVDGFEGTVYEVV